MSPAFTSIPAAAFLPAASLYVAAAKQAGVPLTDLLGGFNADPLKALVRDGALAGAAGYGAGADGRPGRLDRAECAAHDRGRGLDSRRTTTPAPSAVCRRRLRGRPPGSTICGS